VSHALTSRLSDCCRSCNSLTWVWTEATPGWFCQTCGEKAPPVSGREYPFHDLASVGELASRREGVRA